MSPLWPLLRRSKSFVVFCNRTPAGACFSALPERCEAPSFRSWAVAAESAQSSSVWTRRYPPPAHLIQARWKTGYKNRVGARDAVEGDEEGSDDDEEELSDGPDGETPLDGSRYNFPGSPTNYKVVKHHLATLRTDAVLAAGLNISRRKIEDEFLSSKLVVNGERLLKKGVQLKAGDVADLIIEQLEGGAIKVKRVRVIQVDEKRTPSGRIAVILQAWRSAFSPAGETGGG